MIMLLRIFFSTLLLSNYSSSAELVLPKDNYTHFSNQETISGILTDISINSNIRINIDTGIKGTLNGYFPDITIQDLFNRVVNDNNLTWYYDGIMLSVYKNDSIKQKLVRLYNITSDQFKDKLIEMEIYDEKFDWKKTGENILTIFGPPRYIELIDKTLAIVDNQSEIGVKVFPLKNAWADDRAIAIRNTSATVEGVASLLRKLIVGDNVPTFFESNNKSGYRDALAAIKSPSKSSDKDKFTPQISADIRTNGVIVHDYVNKFPIYEKLIEVLDIEMPLIEIAVTIIDLSVNNAKTIGSDWHTKLNLSDDTSNGKATVDFVGGSNFSSVINANVAPALFLKELLYKVKLMEQSGTGKIISRPTILTTNNLKAILDHSKTFHIRSGTVGDKESTVSSVNVGLNLQVTPHIVETDSGQMIHMDIDISDGSIIESGDLNVDNIPLTNQTKIVSQATIREGYSVILGGYYHEQKTSSVKKIPLLGDIPILGYLFKQKDASTKTMERIFIITPKVIDKGNAVAMPKALSEYMDQDGRHRNDVKKVITNDLDKDVSYLTRIDNEHIADLKLILPKVLVNDLGNNVFEFYDSCRRKNDLVSCVGTIRKKFKLDEKIRFMNKDISYLRKNISKIVKRYSYCVNPSGSNSSYCIDMLLQLSSVKPIDSIFKKVYGVDFYTKISSIVNYFDECRENGTNRNTCYIKTVNLIKKDPEFEYIVFPDIKGFKEEGLF